MMHTKTPASETARDHATDLELHLTIVQLVASRATVGAANLLGLSGLTFGDTDDDRFCSRFSVHSLPQVLEPTTGCGPCC